MNDTPLPDFLDIFKMTTDRLLAQKMLTEVEFGRVTQVNPLVITLDSKLPLPAAFLTLTNAVKDHVVDISVSWETEKDNYLDENAMQHTHDGSPLVGNLGNPIAGQTGVTLNFDTTHHHDIKGRKKIIIHNGLTLGERVILLRKRGGQDYIVLDRVDEPKTTGEWI